MSEIDVNQILTQMRTLNGTSRPQARSDQSYDLSFNDLLTQSIEMVNKTQQEAVDLKKSFQSGEGEVELPEVMIALQKANISFEAMKQVRNKLLTAYQEIMSLQV